MIVNVHKIPSENVWKYWKILHLLISVLQNVLHLAEILLKTSFWLLEDLQIFYWKVNTRMVCYNMMKEWLEIVMFALKSLSSEFKRCSRVWRKYLGNIYTDLGIWFFLTFGFLNVLLKLCSLCFWLHKCVMCKAKNHSKNKGMRRGRMEELRFCCQDMVL